MKKGIINILAIIGFALQLNAQTTLHIRSNASSYLDNLTPTTPTGTYQEMDAIAWTAGPSFISRCVFNFDLSSVPVGSTVVSAYLSLWGDTNTSNYEGDSPLSGSNAWSIERVTMPWSSATVTWNTQPTTTAVNEILMPQSTSKFEIYNNVNVTNLMQDIVNNLPNNNGMLIRLDTEVQYRSMVFCSSQYPDTNQRPLLILKYTSPSDTTVDSCPILAVTQEDYLDNLNPTTNNSSFQEIDAIAWTAGPSFISRSVLDFDFSSIPIGSTITSATLSLYGDSNTSNYQGDSPLSGSNDWFIQRVTSVWVGNTVTWNTQPTTDTTHEIHMPQSTSQYEDYPSINATVLVQDMVNNLPNEHGILIRLNTEVQYRSMVFCSNNYPNVARRPSLKVCYKAPTSLSNLTNKPEVSIYPNPSTGLVTIKYNSEGNVTTKYKIYNFLGMLVSNENDLLGAGKDITRTIDISYLPSGIYLIQLYNGYSIVNYRLVKE